MVPADDDGLARIAKVSLPYGYACKIKHFLVKSKEKGRESR